MDLLNIITTDDKKIFDNIINSFVGISAVQIGITNVLLSMGLVPDNLIGKFSNNDTLVVDNDMS